ncbi:MAG: adenylate/guanylate cyclase domain-containing protein [Candidatus Sericytochromatia bacterium]|nr:adenylate/guanylate cyclase domain-containing protein [Candidatus Sericytochromatia bacterium]
MPEIMEQAWEATLAAAPEQVWPWLSDTRRFNRAVGQAFPLDGYEVTPEGDVDLFGQHDLGRFREHPFQWVEPEAFSSRREFLEGPLLELATRIRLVPGKDESGAPSTHLRYAVQATVRDGLPPEVGQVLADVLEGFGKALLQLCDQMNQRHRAGLPAEYVPPTPELDTGALERLSELELRLQRTTRLDVGLVARLVDLVRVGGDLEAGRLRPLALARQWGVPRHDVVRLFLHAVQAGLLDLHWEMTCPHCRGVSKGHTHLADLVEDASCAYCLVNVSSDLASSVEVTFRPNAAVRHIEERMYCSGGPGAMPHVLAQVVVPPFDRRELQLDLGVGTYRLRGQWREGFTRLEIVAGAPGGIGRLHELRCTGTRLEPEGLEVGPGPVRLAIDNAADRPLRLLLERTAWADDRLTAAALTSHGDFRRMFGQEVLAPGTQVSLSRQTILFTDLKNSTQMYENIGDAVSFSLVRDHFAIMEQAISAHGGGIVKTIGDAVMAVFDDPAEAVRSALRMQRDLAEFNRTSGRPPLTLKVGLHSGPGIAVTLNDRLDYFGTTVNMAARVQGESVGDDVVMSESVLADPLVQAVLREEAIPAEPYEAVLKGLGGEHRLTRLWPLRQTVTA